MAYKELLSGEDWAILQSSFFAVFKMIAGADGKIDKKEKDAIDVIIKNSHKLNNSLAKEILQTIPNGDELNSIFDAQKQPAKEILRKTAFILDNKIEPKDALSFKKHLIALGVFIANASGSLFGYKISYDEMDAINEVGRCLNIAVKDLEQTNIIMDIINSIEE